MVCKDIFTGEIVCTDEFMSDGIEIYGGAGIEVNTKRKDQSGTVIDLIDDMKLKEVTLTEEEIKTWSKSYLKKIVDTLKGEDESIESFKTNSTDLLNFILENQSKFRIFTGPSGNKEATLVFIYEK